MNIVVSNLNVGSAIEQSGNQIIRWIQEFVNNIHVFSLQTQECAFYKFLNEKNPDLVIVNSLYPRIITPLYFYKLANPNMDIILFPRVFTDIIPNVETENIYELYYNQRLENILKLAEYIFVINSCGKQNRIPDWLRNKCIDCCGTNSKNDFYIQKPWNKRKKKFVLLGSLNPHKVSPEFIEKIQNTNVQIDAYGKTNNQPKWFHNKFMKCNNITYKGELDYNEVTNVLNEYKYYLLPHNGAEPLCNSLHQAILSGCIPIVLNDYAKDYNGDYWLDFANGMYFGCDNIEDYILCINGLNSYDFKNGEEISKYNREQYLQKYEGKVEKSLKSILKEKVYE